MSICETLTQIPSVKQNLRTMLDYPAIEMHFSVCKTDNTLYTTKPEMGSPEMTGSHWLECDQPVVLIHSHPDKEFFSVYDIINPAQDKYEYVCLLNAPNRKLTCIDITTPEAQKYIRRTRKIFGKPVIRAESRKQLLKLFSTAERQIKQLPEKCSIIV
jgi:proteasome lid subunit RPN8/RPN11